MLTSIYLILSLFGFFFVPHILENITNTINDLLTIDMSGWVYWFLGLIILSIIEGS